MHRVGLVEDDALIRQQFARAIASQPDLSLAFSVGCGADALAALAAEAPDVLMVDIGLPDMSGLDVIRHATAHHPRCLTMVVSVFGDEGKVLDSIAAGAKGYILKGQGEDDILTHLHHLLDGGSPMSPVIARQVLHRMQRLMFPAPAASPPSAGGEPLTPRETEVLKLISRGHSYDEVARNLAVTTNTVRHHIKGIYGKLCVNSRSAAVFEAGRRGWLPGVT